MKGRKNERKGLGKKTPRLNATLYD
jgi:hypothetical protein